MSQGRGYSNSLGSLRRSGNGRKLDSAGASSVCILCKYMRDGTIKASVLILKGGVEEYFRYEYFSDHLVQSEKKKLYADLLTLYEMMLSADSNRHATNIYIRSETIEHNLNSSTSIHIGDKYCDEMIDSIRELYKDSEYIRTINIISDSMMKSGAMKKLAKNLDKM